MEKFGLFFFSDKKLSCSLIVCCSPHVIIPNICRIQTFSPTILQEQNQIEAEYKINNI